MNDLACRALVELVTDYLEGALPPVEHARLEAHLAVCPGCTRYVEQVRATIAAVSACADVVAAARDRRPARRVPG